MATFVLVHGAWHGGWCWRTTVGALEALGHEAHAPTLTGLGERRHLIRADITPDLHVEDVLAVMKWRELSDVILVGHSYGGIVATGVASAAPEQVAGLVYLDAFAPEESGVSPFAGANPARMAKFVEQINAGAAGVAPDKFDAWTDDPDIRAWLETMCTDQPAGTMLNGVTLTGREAEIAHRLFILAERNQPSAFWGEYEKAKAKGWRTTRLPTKHDAMIEAPEALAGLLSDFAAGLQ